MKYDYDIAVVGAGSWGLTVALGLAGAGKKVALIEKWLIWGDCTNFGCVPSKALIDIAKHNPELGFKKAMSEVRARRQIIQDEETVEKIEAHGLKVLRGTASFVNDHTLQVLESWMQPLSLEKGEDSGESWANVTARKIILSTGSRAAMIPLEWVDEDDILTNETIFEQSWDIKKLVIIGGGYIGCEMAESIASLWVEVHLVQRNTHLIPAEEQASSDLLREIFEEKWIHVHTGMTFKSAKWKKMTLENKDGSETVDVSYDKILIALWRIPNTEKLHLDKIWVKWDKKSIIVDKYNRTNKKHIFAIWDCVSDNPQFTHWANHEGRGVIRNILVPFFKKSVRKSALPAVLYTHHEVARVGKTKKQILRKYDATDIVTKKIDFSHNDRSKVTDDTTWFVLIHFKRVSGKILWATVFGTHAGELIAQITYAMDNKLRAYKLAKSIQAYPTKSDLIKRVADSFVVETLSHAKREWKYFLKSNILQIATACIWISVVTSFIWYKRESWLSLEEMALNFYNFISGNVWGPVIYIMAYAIRPIILFPATLMTFMSWALFWLPLGMIFTLIWETLSACFAYFLGRIFGKKLLDEEWGWIITGLKNKVNTDPFMSVLMARFLFFPFDLTNYACGFLKVKFPSYVAATALGIIPGMTVFILAGSAFYNKELTSFSDALKNVDTRYLGYAAILFIVTIVFAKFLKKVRK